VTQSLRCCSIRSIGATGHFNKSWDGALGTFPLIFLIQDNENELIYKSHKDGKNSFGDQVIRNAPAPKKTFEIWLNCYTDDDSSRVCTYGHLTKEEADKECNPWRTACVKLTFTEGDGL